MKEVTRETVFKQAEDYEIIIRKAKELVGNFEYVDERTYAQMCTDFVEEIARLPL